MEFNGNSEQGHIDIGLTLAIWIVLGFVAYMAFASYAPGATEGEVLTAMYAKWIGWPWWAKGLSIIVPIVLLLIGNLFEDARKWPKFPSDDEQHQ